MYAFNWEPFLDEISIKVLTDSPFRKILNQWNRHYFVLSASSHQSIKSIELNNGTIYGTIHTHRNTYCESLIFVFMHYSHCFINNNSLLDNGYGSVWTTNFDISIDLTRRQIKSKWIFCSSERSTSIKLNFYVSYRNRNICAVLYLFIAIIAYVDLFRGTYFYLRQYVCRIGFSPVITLLIEFLRVGIY